MGNVELAVTGIVFVILWGTVTVDMVAEELAAIGNLAITTYTQPVSLYMQHHTVGCILLRRSSE